MPTKMSIVVRGVRLVKKYAAAKQMVKTLRRKIRIVPIEMVIILTRAQENVKSLRKKYF